jgi:hypothetical protein
VTYDLLAHAAIARDFLALRTTKLLCARVERLVEIILLAAGCCVGVVVHICGVVEGCWLLVFVSSSRLSSRVKVDVAVEWIEGLWAPL